MPATLADEGIDLRAPAPAGCGAILSEPALRFVAALHRRFDPTRRELLRSDIQTEQHLTFGRSFE